mmetsp:Transcript_8072/g.15760  ORF Transcript_8072/g.15760 Transcript_8072/m.15760 type:complete len:219 (+) Transcript_8072:157-813(+)
MKSVFVVASSLLVASRAAEIMTCVYTDDQCVSAPSCDIKESDLCFQMGEDSFMKFVVDADNNIKAEFYSDAGCSELVEDQEITGACDQTSPNTYAKAVIAPAVSPGELTIESCAFTEGSCAGESTCDATFTANSCTQVEMEEPAPAAGERRMQAEEQQEQPDTFVQHTVREADFGKLVCSQYFADAECATPISPSDCVTADDCIQTGDSEYRSFQLPA